VSALEKKLATSQALRAYDATAKKPRKPPIPCKGYQISTTDGYDYDCDYAHAGDVDCDSCVCCGGLKDPRTGKRYYKRKRG